MNKRNMLRAMAAGGLSVGLLAGLSACSEPKPAYRGSDISHVDYARDLPLHDHNGQKRSIKDFQGKVVVVFFGYTQCPDVCPASMQELAEAKRLLGADGEKLQGIFVSLDPARDTPEVLKAYMANFDPGFLALHGSDAEIAAVAKDFKIFYKRVDGPTPTSYTMDHSAGSYVYDPSGRLRLYHRYGSGAQAIADDARILLKEKRG